MVRVDLFDGSRKEIETKATVLRRRVDLESIDEIAVLPIIVANQTVGTIGLYHSHKIKPGERLEQIINEADIVASILGVVVAGGSDHMPLKQDRDQRTWFPRSK